MKKGKVSESILKRSVLKYIHTRREAVVKGAGIGSDCAFLKWTDTPGRSQSGLTAISSQTVTLPVRDASSLAVYAAVNNLAASGAEAIAVTISVTLQEEGQEIQLQELMKQAEDTCQKLNVQIAGGHTEVTDLVKMPIITVTAIGKTIWQENRIPGQTEEDHIFSRRQNENNDGGKKRAGKENLDIVMTKWTGLEGTVILAKEKEQELLTRYPLPLVTAAQGFEKYLPILPEAATALKSGVYTMHDIRNGGVFGGLWELSKSMGVGLFIDLKKIPVKQETIEICEFFDLNPYVLLSGGSLLLTVENGEEMVRLLDQAGIPSTVIGRTTDNHDKLIWNEGEVRYLEPAKQDEIFKIKF